MLVTTLHLYTPLNKAFNMVETNCIEANSMYTERVMKVRIPIESSEDPLKIFEETRRKFVKKLTMKDIEMLLDE